MTNKMKKVLIICTAVVAVFVLSFNGKTKSFESDYLDFYYALENFRAVVKSYGDTATAQAELEMASDNLDQWESRMIEESTNKWISFESAWPGPPRNASCHLECAYRLHLCRNGLDGDLFYCLMVYMDCKSNC